MDVFILIITFVFSFLLGSIPWGVIISRLFFNRDVRDTGSGNIGFTNSVRSMGKIGGVSVFVLDFAKGLAAGYLGAVLAPSWMSGSSVFGVENVTALTGAISAFAATAGHIYCPWLNFKGGKGITVAFAASFFAMTPLAACIMFLAFLIVALVSKYVSLGSLVAAVMSPFAGISVHGDCPQAVIFYVLVSIIVFLPTVKTSNAL